MASYNACFSIWPLAEQKFRPQPFRDLIAPVRNSAAGLCGGRCFFLLVLSALAIRTAEIPVLCCFILGCLGAFVVLWGMARLLMRLASRWRPQGAADLRLALANLQTRRADTICHAVSRDRAVASCHRLNIQEILCVKCSVNCQSARPLFFVDIQPAQARRSALVREALALFLLNACPCCGAGLFR